MKDLYGVPPHLIASWLAMSGDSSDNIKGVPGIGPKTACRLLNEHGPLLELLENPEKTGRFASVLREQRDIVLRDLTLATICTDISFDPDPFEEHAFLLGSLDGAAEFFDSLGMKGYRDRVLELGSPEATFADLWY